MKKLFLSLAAAFLFSGKAHALFDYTVTGDYDKTVTFCVNLSSGVEAALGTGLNGTFGRVPFDFNADSWFLTANASGSAVVDVVKDSLANFPPTSADTIVSASTPSASSVQWSSGTTSGWTTSRLKQGDYVGLNVVSISTFKRLTLCLLGTKE